VPVLIVGGVITSFIVERFAREARGHAVPEVMAAVALRAGPHALDHAIVD
jgi:chloride channel protein, CIC family